MSSQAKLGHPLYKIVVLKHKLLDILYIQLYNIQYMYKIIALRSDLCTLNVVIFESGKTTVVAMKDPPLVPLVCETVATYLFPDSMGACSSVTVRGLYTRFFGESQSRSLQNLSRRSFCLLEITEYKRGDWKITKVDVGESWCSSHELTDVSGLHDQI